MNEKDISDTIIAPNRHAVNHFEYKDFVCPCCNTLIIDELFYKHVRLLEKLRLILGTPIIINSGHRCFEHNRVTSKTKNSMHLKIATDIRPIDNDPAKLKRMKEIAIRIGFTGIGTYQSFLHLDCRDEPSQWNG